jgi:hypothetical protein
VVLCAWSSSNTYSNVIIISSLVQKHCILSFSTEVLLVFLWVFNFGWWVVLRLFLVSDSVLDISTSL